MKLDQNHNFHPTLSSYSSLSLKECLHFRGSSQSKNIMEADTISCFELVVCIFGEGGEFLCKTQTHTSLLPVVKPEIYTCHETCDSQKWCLWYLLISNKTSFFSLNMKLEIYICKTDTNIVTTNGILSWLFLAGRSNGQSFSDELHYAWAMSMMVTLLFRLFSLVASLQFRSNVSSFPD